MYPANSSAVLANATNLPQPSFAPPSQEGTPSVTDAPLRTASATGALVEQMNGSTSGKRTRPVDETKDTAPPPPKYARRSSAREEFGEALRQGDELSCARLLEQNRQLLSECDPVTGAPPLLEAVWTGNVRMVRWLLERGANVRQMREPLAWLSVTEVPYEVAAQVRQVLYVYASPRGHARILAQHDILRLLIQHLQTLPGRTDYSLLEDFALLGNLEALQSLFVTLPRNAPESPSLAQRALLNACQSKQWECVIWLGTHIPQEWLHPVAGEALAAAAASGPMNAWNSLTSRIVGNPYANPMLFIGSACNDGQLLQEFLRQGPPLVLSPHLDQAFLAAAGAGRKQNMECIWTNIQRWGGLRPHPLLAYQAAIDGKNPECLAVLQNLDIKLWYADEDVTLLRAFGVSRQMGERMLLPKDRVVVPFILQRVLIEAAKSANQQAWINLLQACGGDSNHLPDICSGLVNEVLRVGGDDDALIFLLDRGCELARYPSLSDLQSARAFPMNSIFFSHTLDFSSRPVLVDCVLSGAEATRRDRADLFPRLREDWQLVLKGEKNPLDCLGGLRFFQAFEKHRQAWGFLIDSEEASPSTDPYPQLMHQLRVATFVLMPFNEECALPLSSDKGFKTRMGPYGKGERPGLTKAETMADAFMQEQLRLLAQLGQTEAAGLVAQWSSLPSVLIKAVDINGEVDRARLLEELKKQGLFFVNRHRLADALTLAWDIAGRQAALDLQGLSLFQALAAVSHSLQERAKNVFASVLRARLNASPGAGANDDLALQAAPAHVQYELPKVYPEMLRKVHAHFGLDETELPRFIEDAIDWQMDQVCQAFGFRTDGAMQMESDHERRRQLIASAREGGKVLPPRWAVESASVPTVEEVDAPGQPT